MRPENWPAMLEAYVAGAGAKPFKWGSHDCVTFAFGWFDLMNGTDLHAPYRGRYDCEFSARRLMLKGGSRSLHTFVDRVMRRHVARLHRVGVNLAPAYAQRGDLIYAQNALGICTGERGAFFGVDRTIELLPTLDATHAWKV